MILVLTFGKKKINYSALKLDNTIWQYYEENNVYYQLGITYCLTPETTIYENLSVNVPGEYMDGLDNGEGTYTCTVNDKGEKSGLTASKASIVVPVKTPGYNGCKAQTEYDYEDASKYIDAGFINAF